MLKSYWKRTTIDYQDTLGSTSQECAMDEIHYYFDNLMM